MLFWLLCLSGAVLSYAQPEGWRMVDRFSGFRYEISGKVQNVGFRKAAQEKADSLGCFGWAQNTAHGTIVGEARCSKAKGPLFKEWLSSGPSLARVDKADIKDYESTKIMLHFSHFKILDDGRITCFREPPHQCPEFAPPRNETNSAVLDDDVLELGDAQLVAKEAEGATVILLRNCQVYAPALLKETAVMLGGGNIAALLDDAAADTMATSLASCPNALVIDLEGEIVVPGIVDVHVHFGGGGGEMGFASRTPEAKLSELIEGGITTAIGLLGTDCVTRSQENLLAKCYALNEEGLTAYMYTGSYAVPPPTITGRVMKDLVLLPHVVGLGECAISDHRSSHPSFEELSRIISEVRVGGMLARKKGVAYFHMGSGDTALDPLLEVVAKTEIPIDQILPCHINRDQRLVTAGIDWVNRGGTIDITSNVKGADDVLRYLKSQGVSMCERVVVSSDAYGSYPEFDEHGHLVGYGVCKPSSTLEVLRSLCLTGEAPWELPEALAMITSTPASFYALTKKGTIAPGQDADLLVLSKEGLRVKYVIAKGQVVKRPGWVKKGMFE